MADKRTVRSAIDALLHERERLGLQREHVLCSNMADGPWVHENGRRFLSFCSNDYLGLSQDARWQKMVADSFAECRPSSSASRLAGGWDRLSAEAESAYAEYFGYEDCLFFPSGYQGNLALMTGLIRKGQPVFADRRIHASAAHALVASGYRLYPYAHNDMEHLERRLKSLESDWQPVVVTESLFSMDGTLTNAEYLARLKKRYGFFLIADEAHAGRRWARCFQPDQGDSRCCSLHAWQRLWFFWCLCPVTLWVCFCPAKSCFGCHALYSHASGPCFSLPEAS